MGQHNSIDALKRWDTHCRSKKSSSSILHKAIQLYGKENFKIETLCICLHAALGNLEAYYAEQYGSYIWDPEPGYNMIWCGNHPRLGIKTTPETIQKIKQALLGKKHTPEHIEKVRQATLGIKRSLETIEKNRQAKLGKKHTPEHIEKMRQAHLGKKDSLETREKKKQAILAYYAKKREEAAASQK